MLTLFYQTLTAEIEKLYKIIKFSILLKFSQRRSWFHKDMCHCFSNDISRNLEHFWVYFVIFTFFLLYYLYFFVVTVILNKTSSRICNHLYLEVLNLIIEDNYIILSKMLTVEEKNINAVLNSNICPRLNSEY